MKLKLLILKAGIMFCFLAININAYGITLDFNGIRLNKQVKSLKEIKNNNVVIQSLDYSCGPAGLATMLNYYFSDNISEKEIIEALLKNTDLAKVKKRKGFSLLDLKRFAESRGYKVSAYRMDSDFLRELNEPVLVPIKFKQYRHFVVVKAVIGDRVFFSDPAVGNMTMKVTNFNYIWQDGVGFVLEENQVNRDPFKPPMEYFLKMQAKEAAIADYKNIKRNLEIRTIRSAVFPAEF